MIEIWIAVFFVFVALVFGFVLGAKWMKGEMSCAVPYKIEPSDRRLR